MFGKHPPFNHLHTTVTCSFASFRQKKGGEKVQEDDCVSFQYHCQMTKTATLLLRLALLATLCCCLFKIMFLKYAQGW